MPRRLIIKVVKVTYTPCAPWMVRVPRDLRAQEGSERKFFEKKAVASAYAEWLAGELGEYHARMFGLTSRQKVEAAECYRLLGKDGGSLLEAVHHYLGHLAHKRSYPLRPPGSSTNS